MSYAIIGYACDLAGAHRGAAAGPRVLRERGLHKCFSDLNKPFVDLGDVHSGLDPNMPTLSSGEATMKNAPEVYGACSSLYKKTSEALEAKHTPIVLGGDHSGAIGSFAAVSDYYQKQGQKVGLIYIDAHPDIHNWSSSTSRLIFGTTISVLSGNAQGAFASIQKYSPSLDLDKVAYLAIRDVDPGERDFISKSPVTSLTIKEIDRHGMGVCVQRAIEVASKDTIGFFVSFDIDACDPQLAPGTQVPFRGGISFRESHLALEMIYESKKLLGLELSEFHPGFDVEHKTADFCLSLIESAIGKSIL